MDGINVYNTDYTGDDKLSNNNNKDYWCLVQEVQHYGDEAADLQANKTTLLPPVMIGLSKMLTTCKRRARAAVSSPRSSPRQFKLPPNTALT